MRLPPVLGRELTTTIALENEEGSGCTRTIAPMLHVWPTTCSHHSKSSAPLGGSRLRGKRSNQPVPLLVNECSEVVFNHTRNRFDNAACNLRKFRREARVSVVYPLFQGIASF